MWVNFAKTGDPSSEKTKWDAYEEKERKTMVIQADKPHMEADILPFQREMLMPLLSAWISPSYADIDYSMLFIIKIFVLLNALFTAWGAQLYARRHRID